MMPASWGYAYGPTRVVESGALEHLNHLRKILDDRMFVLWAVGHRSRVIQDRKWERVTYGWFCDHWCDLSLEM